MDALPERRPREFGNYKVLCKIVDYLQEIHGNIPSEIPSTWLSSMELYEHIHKRWVPRRNERSIDDFQMLFSVAEYIRISMIRHIRHVQDTFPEETFTSSREALERIKDELIDRISEYDMDCLEWQRFRDAQIMGGEFEWTSSTKAMVEDWIEHMADATKVYLRMFYNHS